MKIIDISMGIEPGMPVYKNQQEKKPKLIVLKDFSNSSSYESEMDINLHTGTHIDAPLHMIENGKTIERMDLAKLITWCKVLDFSYAEDCITKKDLESKSIKQGDFILLKTKNSLQEQISSDFVFLEKSGAEYLSGKNIKGVGIDSLGIERSQPEHDTHIALLEREIIIMEGLRLGDVDEGEYFLIAMPIKIIGAEAAPARAILLDPVCE